MEHCDPKTPQPHRPDSPPPNMKYKWTGKFPGFEEFGRTKAFWDGNQALYDFGPEGWQLEVEHSHWPGPCKPGAVHVAIVSPFAEPLQPLPLSQIFPEDQYDLGSVTPDSYKLVMKVSPELQEDSVPWADYETRMGELAIEECGHLVHIMPGTPYGSILRKRKQQKQENEQLLAKMQQILVDANRDIKKLNAIMLKVTQIRQRNAKIMAKLNTKYSVWETLRQDLREFGREVVVIFRETFRFR